MKSKVTLRTVENLKQYAVRFLQNLLCTVLRCTGRFHIRTTSQLSQGNEMGCHSVLCDSVNCHGVTASVTIHGVIVSVNYHGVTVSVNCHGVTVSVNCHGVTASVTIHGVTVSVTIHGVTVSVNCHGVKYCSAKYNTAAFFLPSSPNSKASPWRRSISNCVDCDDGFAVGSNGGDETGVWAGRNCRLKASESMRNRSRCSSDKIKRCSSSASCREFNRSKWTGDNNCCITEGDGPRERPSNRGEPTKTGLPVGSSKLTPLENARLGGKRLCRCCCSWRREFWPCSWLSVKARCEERWLVSGDGVWWGFCTWDRWLNCGDGVNCSGWTCLL